jgi:cell division protein FtsQ
MPEQGADILAHFGDQQFLTRYQRYKAHIAEWRQQYPRLAAVDLRYEQQVVLQMSPGSGPSVTAGESGASVDATSAKPSPATPADEVSKPAPKPAAKSPEHKPHAKPSPKTAIQRKREEARKAALARKQRLTNAANGQTQ